MTAPLLPPWPVGLYVHVPFCLSKCAYCDFTSSAASEQLFAPFVDAAAYHAGHLSHFGLLDDVETLYVGGGTPTVLGEHLVRLIQELTVAATVRPGAEITIETNPETTGRGLVRELIAAGATRFSLGVQSLDDEVLRTLGRAHDAAGALRAAKVLKRSGANFSVDLICGVPGQTMKSWRTTLDAAINTGAGHASVYPLSVEAGTPLARCVETGTLSEPDPDLAADMLLIAEKVLADAGLARYEVANYSRAGQVSRHNSRYWTGGAYVGIGPSASSMLPVERLTALFEAEAWDREPPRGRGLPAPGALDVRARFTADEDTLAFLRDPLAPPATLEYLSEQEAAREDAMLGLRMTAGITDELAARAGVTAVLEELASKWLVEHAAGRWKPTTRGWLLGNEVFSAVWAGE